MMPDGVDPVSGRSGLPLVEPLITLLDHGSRLVRRTLEKGENAAAVLDFLRGRLAFSARDDDIFVASYPRAGTTWMQFIVYQMTTDGDMSFDHISQVSPWFERSLALGLCKAADYERFPSPRIFKTHLLPHWLPSEGRTIYMHRNGKDVLCSYYHFYRSHLGFTGSFDDFFQRFMSGRLQYRSWFEHVARWRAVEHRANVLFVAYEELMTDFEATIERIAAFCGISLTTKTKDRVLSRCSFACMKKHQRKFDHLTSVLLEKGVMTDSFIRMGRMGDAEGYLCESQQQRFERHREQARYQRFPERHLADFLH